MLLPYTSTEPLPSGFIAHRLLMFPAGLSRYSQRWYRILPSGSITGLCSFSGLLLNARIPLPSASIRYRFVTVN